MPESGVTKHNYLFCQFVNPARGHEGDRCDCFDTPSQRRTTLAKQRLARLRANREINRASTSNDPESAVASDPAVTFAFRRNIHPSLHIKLLGVSPIPTTLSRLVKLAKEFDQSFWMWSANPSNSSSPQNFRTFPCICVSDANTPDSTQINANSLSRTKPSRPQQGGSKKFGPLSQEEKDHHRRNNLCSYCGGQNHFADRCPKKPFRPSSSSRQNVYHVRGAQLIEEENDQSLEEGEILEPPTVSRLYHEPASIYNVDIPDPDPDSQDF